jgi:hypothetical protein
MDKNPPANAEALARKLQENLQRQRPRWVRWLPALAGILLVVLAVLAWALYPKPDPPRLTVTAMDELNVRGEPAVVHAFLDPENPDSKVDSLKGLEADFWVAKPPPALDDAPRQKVVSDTHGQTTTKLDAGDAAKIKFHVRHAVPLKKQDPPQDEARIFAVAKDAPLLLVDVEETLADLDPKLWTKTNALNIAVRAGASEALKIARDKHGYAIAYLAVELTPAREYRRVRGWIGIKASGPEALPDGPVLGRLRYDSGDVHSARHALLSDLRERFTGPIVAVVRDADAAEQCVNLKIRALAMGGGDFPDAVVRLKTWQDLPAALGK